MQDEENKVNNNVVTEADSQVYEIGYLLVPTIAEDDVPVSYGNLKELVSSFGGEIISDEMPKMTTLAYTMSKVISNVRHKFDTAYFGWVKFAMSAENISDLKKRLDLDPSYIRFLILKTVRENTIAGKRFMHRDMYKRPTTKRSQTGEPAAPINKEAIDKEIDALVSA